MLKLGDRRLACGLGHEKVLGLGHTLIWDWDSDAEIEDTKAVKRKTMEKRALSETAIGLVVYLYCM